MLTLKREAFAQAVANGKTQADAYREAFNAANMKPETIWSKASELMADGKVAARVEELRELLASKQLWSREDSVNTLKSIIESSDKASDTISAVKELNSMHGYNAPSKHEHSGAVGVIINVGFD